MSVTHHPVAEYSAVVTPTAQFLDVRQPEELAAGSLPGAINIPLGELPTRITELDRRRRVVLVCRSGGRSMQAAEFLVAAGFGDVVNLEGGMMGFGS